MRKPMSNMTDSEFVRILGALRFDHIAMANELARVLQRRRAYSRAMISHYATGRCPIPLDVAQAAHTLCEEKARELHGITARGEYAVTALRNMHMGPSRKGHTATEGRFMNRQQGDGVNTTMLPPYRMRPKHYGTLVHALVAWKAHVHELAKKHGSPDHQKDYQMELADLRAIVTHMPRELPYEFHVQVSEWGVIARALRHYHQAHQSKAAYAIYQHWRRHRGGGFPTYYKAACGCQHLTATKRVVNPCREHAAGS